MTVPDDAAPGGDRPTDDASRAVRRLDDDTVDRIAAGEVVTRPADVVKELVENALDAGAGRIEVTVSGDGTEEIRVSDDGRGMTEPDARLAVERHTTSKVGDGAVEHVSTLGFRGEALPAIASVSRFELVTCSGDAPGVRVTVDGDGRGEALGSVEVRPAGRAPGTTVSVRDLFYNRAARRKSLAAGRTEFSRVADVVSRYALVRPDVAFVLTHDGHQTLSTPGSGRYEDAVLGVYDRTTAARSTQFDHETVLDVGDGRDGVDDERDADGVAVRVEGLLVYPSVTRTKREHVHVGVNGRALRDERLRRAVVSGYGSLLPSGRAPVAVVTLTVPPTFVDVNVHPAKESVAFLDGDAVGDVVETAVREALSTADLRRSSEVATDLGSALERETGESVLADVTPLGQYRGTYLLCEASDGDLLVVDQHAAHERINYERLRDAVESEAAETIELDPPETVSLTPAEAAVVDEAGDLLAAVGFAVSRFGGDTYRLTRVPAPLGRPADPDALRDAIDAVRDGESPTDARDALLADLACHPSLKAGDALSEEEMVGLVERLGTCDQPFACPHGRPTVLSVDEATLIRGFERHARLG